MKRRERNYLGMQRIVRYVNRYKGSCPQFPHFGAHYPDACCIDGRLWDLDKSDDGLLYGGGDDPCPRCNAIEYVQEGIDSEVPIRKLYAHIKFIFERYGN